MLEKKEFKNLKRLSLRKNINVFKEYWQNSPWHKSQTPNTSEMYDETDSLIASLLTCFNILYFKAWSHERQMFEAMKR